MVVKGQVAGAKAWLDAVGWSREMVARARQPLCVHAQAAHFIAADVLAEYQVREHLNSK